MAIGIACASLIFLWTEDEWTFNHNFSKREYLYRIYENQTYEGKISTFHATPGPMANVVKADIPGIKNVARSGGTGNQLFALGDKSINEVMAGPSTLSGNCIPWSSMRRCPKNSLAGRIPSAKTYA